MGFFENLWTVFDAIGNPSEYADTGKSGERFTYRILDEIYYAKQIFRNLYIKQKSGKYTEIDLASVDHGALIVYESKNYSGWIFGSEDSSQWTQSLPGGKKLRFYNPVKQNNTHIEALKEYLSGYQLEYHSVIVFSERCELKKIECSTPNTHVIKRDMLKATVKRIRKNADKHLTDEQLNEIIALLKKIQRPEKEIREQHLKDVEETLTTCPRCGGELAERTAKATGNKFMGCKNFPKCRFTKAM